MTEFSITNKEFSPELSDETSPLFKREAATLEGEVRTRCYVTLLPVRYVVYARLCYLMCFCDHMKCNVMLRQPMLVITATQFVKIFIYIFFKMEEALQFSKLGKFFADAKVLEFRYVCMFVII